MCCCHNQGEGHRCPGAWALIAAAQQAYRQRRQPEVLALRRAYTQHLQAVGLLSLAGLTFRWFATARAAAAVQVTLIVFGWAVSQYPYLVVPDVKLPEAAAPLPILRLLIWSLLIGGLVLFPSLFYLYRLFKSHALFTPPAGGEANCPSSDILSENAARHDKKSETI